MKTTTQASLGKTSLYSAKGRLVGIRIDFCVWRRLAASTLEAGDENSRVRAFRDRFNRPILIADDDYLGHVSQIHRESERLPDESHVDPDEA